jgi:cation diffusion facilitator CzcD-associated flavoprotein CzcO
MTQNCDVAIAGAGPYGLSVAAHLRAAGRNIRLFGRPMDFWQEHMPKGMLLRSSWRSSHISAPEGDCTLESFARLGRVERRHNVSRDDFVQYGLWFQQTLAPEVDTRRIDCVERIGNSFRLALADGEVLHAARVVIATGLLGHEVRPPEFDHLPAELASHSSEVSDFAKFRNRTVIVLGSGQSAIESAALLSEAGAEVELLARALNVHWLSTPGEANGGYSTAVRRWGGRLAPHTEVGPFPLNWLVHKPTVYRAFPAPLARRIAGRVLRPSAAGWLRPRVSSIRMTLGQHVVSVEEANGKARVRLDDGRSWSADHVLLATGYRVEIRRMGVLSRSLADAVSTEMGSPILSSTLESSVPGLYFVGAAAVHSCGPVMRFVSGTYAASQAVLRGVSSAAPATIGAKSPRAVGSVG